MKRPKKLPSPFAKRVGPLTKDEKKLIRQFMADLPHEITSDQIQQLARLMKRYPKTIRQCVEQARYEFAANAEFYVETHYRATVAAFESGDYDTAAKAAQWAIEHISSEGVRIVDAIDKRAGGNFPPVVHIGVPQGGLGLPPKPAEAEPGDAASDE